MSAETLHPMLRRAPSVQDYERMTDQVRRAAYKLAAAQHEALEARARAVRVGDEPDPTPRQRVTVEQWAEAVRTAAAHIAPTIAQQHGDTPWAQAARLAALEGIIP